jgi:hypothetical protein
MFCFKNYFETLIAGLKAQFPSVPTIEEYPQLRKKITAPSILVDLADLTPLADPGTGQLTLSARFEARVILDQVPSPDGVKSVLALDLAAAVAQYLFTRGRWGEAGSAGEFRVEPDQFKPELAAYCAYLVEWTHEIRLGTSVWTGDGVTPTQIYVGLDPEVGSGHEDDYVEVVDV